MKHLTLVMTVLLLSGCAGQMPFLNAHQANTAQPVCSPLNNDQELIAGMAEQLVDQGQFHAALATLEQLPESLPEARMRKAQVLRVLDKPEAHALYLSLLDTCVAAQGYHGLGQLAAARGDLAEAESQLRQAIKLEPVNGAMRNDLGVVYLRERKIEQAQFELMTALQLSADGTRASENLLTLLLYQGRWQEAGELANRETIAPARFQVARANAVRLQQQDGLQADPAAEYRSDSAESGAGREI